MKRTCVVSFFSLFCLLSCGLEDFAYIDYIPNNNIRLTESIRATVKLPSSSNDGYGANGNYFTRFIIFYRIYTSSTGVEGLIASTETNNIYIDDLNSTLNNDFRALYSSTDKTSTSVTTTNLENTFYRRNYFLLTLEKANIDNVLGSGSLGETLEIRFDRRPGFPPKLILGTNEYTLQRAEDGPGLNFYPQPNRHFLNHPDLYNTANITPQINPDVAAYASTNADICYSYVSMYIAAVGKSLDLPPRTIYSQPSFIGVFRLAESS